MSRANFYKWVQAFKDGRESITDDLRSGRPVDVSTPEAVQAVEDLIKSDRRVTLDEIATNLDISHGTVYAIVPTFSQPSRAKTNVGPMMNVFLPQ